MALPASTTATAPAPSATERKTNGTVKTDSANNTDDADNTDVETQPKYRDFFWTYTEEPHRSRRLAIIKAHPEVTKLCGPEPLTKYVVAFVVSLQIFLGWSLRNYAFFSWQFWAVAYVFGATANQNLFLAIHEISHNLAFRSPLANRLLAIVANLPIGIPYSASFRPYHLTHHKSLGVDGLDTDLPTAFEAIFLDSILGKSFFCTFQIFFYALRPMAVLSIPFTWVQGLNVVVQGLFDYVLIRNFGWMPFMYLLLSSFLAGSLHPLAGHFIAEHYVYDTVEPDAKNPANNIPIPETYSYYGPLNIFAYNVGYHNEHHDFPAVPWTRLHRLYETAPEFYKSLPRHESWTYVIWRFIWDDSVGLRCRVKRKQGGRLVGGAAKAAGWTKEEIEA
ncbi:dihydroceramide delta -desaturase [Ophiostoma piceae UAMH 11346]|uniref:Sphingolipid delta(4)-desaturase n=1 Tax=Ophiostoma piceae (strain UAMH 11346) TaxID=1262450 RepID=S3CGE3_OPHP1|nr:dihydroceramide delta -desaturase [Ophiostoma piceae UAMH 11346]